MRSDVTLFEYVKDVGAGRLRKRMAAIPDDDPLLAGGWEHIKPELAKLGVLKMQDQATARAKAEQVAAADVYLGACGHGGSERGCIGNP